MKTYSEYRAVARQTLGDRWNEAALVMFFITLVAALFSGPNACGSLLHWSSVFTNAWSGLYFAAVILLIMPLQAVFSIILLRWVRGSEERLLESTWQTFLHKFEHVVVPMALMFVIVIAVSVVTLCIGGIIFAFAYAMVPFVIEDHPDMSAREVLRTSREMMRGHKWELFVLELSYIGWILLCIITFGVAMFWVEPWMTTAMAHFYEDIKPQTLDEAAPIAE